MEALAIIFAVLAAVLLGSVALIFLVVPFFKGLFWLVKHVAKFIWGMFSDLLRCVGAILLSVFYIPLILGNFIIARFSSASHFGRALTHELGTAGVCIYRVVIGHPARLFLLGGLTEGLERRLPAVMAAAPTSDLPKGGGKRGLFEGYTIVGSLPGGGSGAKLYVADPDAVKLATFNRAGITVGQVVIKAFSLADGSSLPQIVRESRSLDAAKRLGLILDHELTPERFHYVMRYVPGESLSLVTKQLHASSPADGLGDPQLAAAVQYTIDLVSTLSTYHRGGLWHKDVKPDNIIVATKSDRRAHLVDFGLVSSLGSAMTLTTHGTEYFRDPEMVRMALKGVKVHQVDGTRFDIYAAGAVLYSIVEDSFPAHGVLSQVSRRCPEAVKWVIRRAMTDYDKRYDSADVMLADLDFIAQSDNAFAVRPIQLPSMRGGSPAPHDAYAAVGTSPPPLPNTPPYVGAAPRPRAHAAAGGPPRIRVTNWWSGAAAVEGAPPAGPIPEEWSGVAQRAVAVAQRGVQEAQSRLNAVFGGAAAATPPPAPAQTPRTQRRPAAEQLRSARERAQARRDRAQTRLDGFRAATPTRHFKAGMGGGVGVALLVFFGGLFGLGAIITNSISNRQVGSRVQLMESLESDSRHALAAAQFGSDHAHATTEASYFDDPAAPTAVIVKTAPKPKATRSSSKRVSAPTPPTAPAAPLLPIDRTVLIVSDLKPPVSEAHTQRLRSLSQSLSAAGVRLLGETGQTDRTLSDEELGATAQAKFALGTTPLDSDDAVTRLNAWISERNGDINAVLWISPSLRPDSDAPTFRLFGTGHESREDQERLFRVFDLVTASQPQPR